MEILHPPLKLLDSLLSKTVTLIIYPHFHLMFQQEVVHFFSQLFNSQKWPMYWICHSNSTWWQGMKQDFQPSWYQPLKHPAHARLYLNNILLSKYTHDHERRLRELSPERKINGLIFYQNPPTNSLRKCVEIRMENLYIDIRAYNSHWSLCYKELTVIKEKPPASSYYISTGIPLT